MRVTRRYITKKELACLFNFFLVVCKLVLSLSVDNFFLGRAWIALIFIELFKEKFKLVPDGIDTLYTVFLLRKRIKLMKNE